MGLAPVEWLQQVIELFSASEANKDAKFDSSSDTTALAPAYETTCYMSMLALCSQLSGAQC
jgi:hypothetical protein